MPSTTPNTATWSHSRPLTRWIVDTVTPLRVAFGVERFAPTMPRTSPRRDAGRRRRSARRGRRDGWRPARRRCGRAGSSPSRARRRRGRPRGCAVSIRAGRHRRRGGGRRRGRGPWAGPCREPSMPALRLLRPSTMRRREMRSENHCGRPRDGRRRISTTSRGGEAVWIAWRCAGRRGRRAARCGRGGRASRRS